ncbi:MAG: chromosome segregation protein SMC [Oscillospiraceae bacterium]|nr:chromosome segregation protein SMC [Oscillospiraceae bacterium]
MYLKAVEIQGFKSFPDKTRLSFENDITAIVGPNGSGKSNISDAIRWVMGEQRTKQLRGEKMEDVIFGGTEKRGKLGYAQVSLIFDNTSRFFDMDASEVVLTRAYYRSGESEYYINHEQVRLRDVNELLMDTGLGRDGYSTIGQGRIAEIVSGSGKERREVLEEAAGISRYRYRKEEAERKLDRTQENLVRINDRIAELELQVAPLKKQAEVARQCLAYREELKTLEVSVWLNDLDQLHDRSAAVINDYERSKQDLDAAHAELERLYAAGEALNARMQEKTLELEGLRATLSHGESDAAELESGAAVLRANLQNALDGIERMRGEMAEQETRADALDRQIAGHDARLGEIAAELSSVAEQNEALMKSAAENAEHSGAARREYLALTEEESGQSGELTRCRTLMNMLTERLDECRAREQAVQDNLLAAHEKLTEISSQLQDCEERCRTAERRVTETRTAVQQRKDEAAQAARILDETRTRQNTLLSDRKVADSRISLLEDMEREHEGYNRAVRFVLKEKERGTLRGIRGAVGELIHTEDAYAIAIETALGAAAQNIVVETQEDGAAAIELLKRRDMGRCTFLPMNVITGQRPGDLPDRDPGFVGVADALVTCDRDYGEIVSNLLGRTVVVRTMADAIRISRQKWKYLRMVTLDGQMINAGGSMTGGSLAKNTGIISRANELKRLKARREALDSDLRACEADLKQQANTLSDRNFAAETAQNVLDAAEEILRRHRSDAERYRLLRDSVQASADALTQEAEDARNQTAENRRRLEETRQQTAALEETLTALRARIAGMTAGQTEYEQIRQNLADQQAQLRAREASLRAEQSAVERAKEQVAEMRRSVDADRTSRQTAVEQAETAVESLRAAITERETAIAGNAGKIARVRAQIEEVNRRRMELEGERTRSDKQSQDCNRQLLELERLCAKFEQKKLASDLEEKQIIDRLWDNYGLSHSAALELRQPVEKPAAASRRISELHKAITALGTPNFGAIDEYARVSERYEFLTSQRDDVETSKKEIQEIIREVTQQMKEVFMTQFRILNDTFRETFLELFGGGKAALVLQNEEDVLSCDIDIRVQPPGKAVSSINLLSGGEMAFVAIALYFAIIKVRPTPFCVMDEIEAALDEANVIRFAEYLRKMSGNTQFIVITHRRGTMEEANRLYGVTMQEKGVSQVIELDVAEAERQIAAEEG